jgi:hypothetical protein
VFPEFPFGLPELAPLYTKAHLVRPDLDAAVNVMIQSTISPPQCRSFRNPPCGAVVGRLKSAVPAVV